MNSKIFDLEFDNLITKFQKVSFIEHYLEKIKQIIKFQKVCDKKQKFDYNLLKNSDYNLIKNINKYEMDLYLLTNFDIKKALPSFKKVYLKNIPLRQNEKWPEFKHNNKTYDMFYFRQLLFGGGGSGSSYKFFVFIELEDIYKCVGIFTCDYNKTFQFLPKYQIYYFLINNSNEYKEYILKEIEIKKQLKKDTFDFSSIEQYEEQIEGH